jgi:hypothetical protein
LLEVGAGGGIDVFSLTHGQAPPEARLATDRTETSFVLASLVAMHFAPSSSFRLFVAAGVDWDLAPRRYVLERDGARTTVLAPLAVRPGVTFGFAFDVASAGGAR